MCVTVTATIPAGQFALRDTLSSVPNAAFELVQHVARSAGEMSLLWAVSPDVEHLVDVVRADATVADVEVLTTDDGASLLRVEWIREVRAVVDDLLATNATVTSASATASGWCLKFLFVDRSAVSEAHEACRRHDVEMNLESIRSLSGSSEKGRFDLTDSQHDTLVAAHRAGYYEVPRGVKLAELAEELGISHQTLSERLRRGHRSLVGSTVLPHAGTAHVELG